MVKWAAGNERIMYIFVEYLDGKIHLQTPRNKRSVNNRMSHNIKV
jgi:hypothetical protein